MNKIPGKIENYLVISRIIILSFILNSIILVVLHLLVVNCYLDRLFGDLIAEILKQFFIGALGATISCSIFLANDKEINELESLEDNPSPKKLRYPTKEDVHLYFQRIYTSGILAIVGVLVFLAGFSYVDVDISDFGLKHKILFAVSSFLIGLFQHKFYEHLQSLFNKFFSQNTTEDKDSEK